MMGEPFTFLDGAFSFKDGDIRAIHDLFCDNAELIITATGARDYSINDDAFADAMLDIQQDLQIISYRRIKAANATGISDGKVAGIYAFRLSRSPILQFCKSGKDGNIKDDKQIQTVVSLLTAFECVGFSVKNLNPSLFRELVYNIRKRHVNQETLALVIDILISKARQSG